MHECMPWILHKVQTLNIHIEEYFHERIVGDSTGSTSIVTRPTLERSAFVQDNVQTAYIGPVLD